MYTNKHCNNKQQEVFKKTIEKLKELIQNKLVNKINIDEFINQTRMLIEKISISYIDFLRTDDIKLLKILSNNYLDIFIKDGLLIKYEDLATLAAFNFQKWLTEKGEQDLRKILHQIQEDALNLRLNSGDMHVCQKILMLKNELFNITLFEKEKLNTYLNRYLIEMINKKFLNAAYEFFINKIKPNLSKDELNSLLYNIFCEVFSSQDVVYLAETVKKFKINFKNYLLKFNLADNQVVEMSVISAVFYLKARESREKYLLFLKKHNVHPDSDKDSDYFEEKMKSMTALLMASNQGKLEMVELLVKHGADINQAILYKNNLGEILSCRTPFSVAFGTGDIAFVKLLVYKFGANPLTAIINTTQHLKLAQKDFPNVYCIIPSMGAGELSARIGKEEYEKYTSDYYEIIENYFLKYLLEYGTHKKETPTKKKISSKELPTPFLPVYDKQLIVSSNLLSSIAAVDSVNSVAAISKPFVKPIDIDEKLFSDYLDFKKFISKRKSQRSSLENEFDMLLLEYIQVNSEENLKKMHDFINENPEIEFYLITTVLQNVDNAEDVKDILINKPHMLHKFFKIKKQYSDLLVNKNEETIEVIPEGVYKVQSNLNNALYVAISSTVKEKLGYDNPILLHKFTEQLNCCKFIEAKSKGFSGIKIIGGIIKLKLANENVSIATDVKYVNESSLSTLILFDRIIDHGFKYTSKSIKIHKVNDFSDILRKSKKTESAESVVQAFGM